MIHFSDTIHSQFKPFNAAENYFDFSWLPGKLGNRKFKQVCLNGTKLVVKESRVHSKTRFIDVAKRVAIIASYATLFIPAIMLGIKGYYRSRYQISTAQPKKAGTYKAAGHAMGETAKKVRIASYNLLFPQMAYNEKLDKKKATAIGYSQDSEGNVYENSQFRTPLAIQNMLHSKADIVCLQEVNSKIYQQIKNDKKLSAKYHFSILGAHNPQHGVCVLYNKKMFQDVSAKANGVFHRVSLNGAKIKNKNRTHLHLDLKDKVTGKELRVISCHMEDPRSFTTGKKDTHAKEVLKTALEGAHQENRITIVAGDMNQDQFGDAPVSDKSKIAHPDLKLASAFKGFFEAGFAVDDDLSPSEYYKVNNFFDNSPLVEKDRRIDWIFAKGAKPMPINPQGLHIDKRASDHRLVLAEIELA